MKLTKHFSLDEFTRSATVQANGVDNTLDMTKADDRIVVENLEHLCQTVLEPLREQMGTPVIISSGYRCRELNRLVGGARNSQHLVGEAADIASPRPSPEGKGELKRWFLFIQQHCRFDQLILETRGDRRWIHVSCCRDDSQNRQTCFTKKVC